MIDLLHDVHAADHILIGDWLRAIGCQSASLSHAPGEWADGPAPGFQEADTLADFVPVDPERLVVPLPEDSEE